MFTNVLAFAVVRATPLESEFRSVVPALAVSSEPNVRFCVPDRTSVPAQVLVSGPLPEIVPAQVPVIPAVEGDPAPGFVVGKATSNPPTVEVVGPESAVKQATEALTEQISVAGARELVRETVKVGMADAALRLKTSRPVVVDVQIVPAPVERTLHSLPVHLKNLAGNLTAQSNPVTVDVGLRGSREELGRVRFDDVNAYIDLAGLGTGEYSLPVRADVARDAGVTRIDPPLVQVRITFGKN